MGQAIDYILTGLIRQELRRLKGKGCHPRNLRSLSDQSEIHLFNYDSTGRGWVGMVVEFVFTRLVERHRVALAFAETSLRVKFGKIGMDRVRIRSRPHRTSAVIRKFNGA